MMTTTSEKQMKTLTITHIQGIAFQGGGAHVYTASHRLNLVDDIRRLGVRAFVRAPRV